MLTVTNALNMNYRKPRTTHAPWKSMLIIAIFVISAIALLPEAFAANPVSIDFTDVQSTDCAYPISGDRYQALGVVFSSPGPLGVCPETGPAPYCLGGEDFDWNEYFVEPITITFVQPGSADAAPTDFVSFYWFNGNATWQAQLYAVDGTLLQTYSGTGPSTTVTLQRATYDVYQVVISANSQPSGFPGFVEIGNVEFDPASPITITTLPATSVGNLAATLEGTVNANGLAVTTSFQYGTGTDYGNVIASQSIESGTTGVMPIATNILGLEPDTIYHYRAVGVVGGVTYYGDDHTVTTQPGLLTLAWLSSDVYSPDPQGFPSVLPHAGNPPFYYFMGDYSDMAASLEPPPGFAATFYGSKDGSQIIVAFRGTAFPLSAPLANLFADYSFPSGAPNGWLHNYVYAAATFISSVNQTHGQNANITVTGHSLGGALAQMIGARTGLTTSTFNAPGSAGIYPLVLEDLNDGLVYGGNPWAAGPLGENSNVNYRIDTDQVSLAGMSFPSVITITSPDPLPTFSAPYLPQFLANVFQFLYNHSIGTVITQIAIDAPQTAGIPANDQNVLKELGNLVEPYFTSVGIASQSYWNSSGFTFTVNNTSGTLINVLPSDNSQQTEGTDFIFSESTGSPGINACILPVMNGVNSYEIRSETGNIWSTFQSVQPGTEFTFDPVTAFEFIPIDSNGNPVAVTNVVMALSFASTGIVSGTLIQSIPNGISTNCAVSAPEGLVSWWTGKQTANDFMGTNNGTLVNGVTYAPGEVNYAFSFNGTNQYVAINAADSLTGTFTLDLWVMPMNTNIMDLIGSLGPGDFSYELSLYGSYIHSEIGNGNSWIDASANATFSYQPGNWYHIAEVVTPTNYIMYVNGAVAGSGSHPIDTPVLFDANHQLDIGYIGAHSSNYMVGSIDELQIYNRALSPSEIEVIYLAGTNGMCAPVSVPTVQFIANPTNGAVPLTVQFTSASIDSVNNSIAGWSWEFGDGSVSSQQNPTHIYTTNGTYYPSLIATHSGGFQVLGVGPSPSISVSLVCTMSLDSNTNVFTSDGGAGMVDVQNTSGCVWTATNNVDWLTITAGSSGSGSGAVNYAVAPNTNYVSRVGTISIGDQVLTIYEEGAAGQGVTFTNETFNVGSGPFSAVAADINGDGKLDLICANSGNGFGNTLTVLTNNGSGGFGFSATLTVGNNPQSVVAADVNGDGKLDLICGNDNDGTLTVLTNNGSGVFGYNATLNVDQNPQCVIAADMNGDGKVDLISANNYVNTLTVLTNNGSGIFGYNATLNVGNTPYSLVAADVNGDGKLDLICANYYGNTLTVFTNNGSGVFGLKATLTVGINPLCVIAADINGDGKPDLICANSGENTLTVLTNDGSGVFGLNATLNVGNRPYPVVAADVNGDGKLDLICGNNNDATLTVLTNNGSGVFGYNATLNVGNGPDSLVAADINGDGKLDLICANNLDNTLTVLFSTGVFTTPLTISYLGNSVVVSWLNAGSYTLQQNSNLATRSWTTSAYSITTTNGTNSITITPPTGNLFFRLVNP
jgi:PKD repeat protein